MTTDPTTGPQIVSGDYDEAGVNYDAMLREIKVRKMAAVDIIDELRAVLGLSPGQPLTEAVTRLRDDLARLRSQLAEAREQRDQAAEALVRAETERDEALCAITKIAEVLGFPGGDLREAIRALRRERDDALQEAESVGRQLHSSTREVDRLIAQLATVTEERDEARAEIARLERAAHEQGADLWIAEDRFSALVDEIWRHIGQHDCDSYGHCLARICDRAQAFARREVEALRIERDEARAAISRLALAVAGLADDTMARAQQAAAGEPPDAAEELAAVARRMLTLLPDEPPAATAPETGPTAPQTDEQAQVRGESHTEHAGTVHDALHRIADQPATARVDLVIGLRQRGVPQHPDGPEAAALAEIDRLRTEVKQLGAEREWLADRARTMGIAEAFIAAHGPARAVIVEAGRLRAKVKHLSACVREWEAVNADLAARCDSGDIPIRLGERYSVAVLREIDRLRTALNSQGGSR